MSDEDGFEAEFPWGVLLLTDSASREMIPTWASPEVTVAVAQTALVVRVRHADDGPVDVRAVHSASAVRGSLVWDGRISVHSGVLRLSDALGEQSFDLPVERADLRVRLFANDPHEASEVDVLLG
ncbi:MAG: hypothetical protein KBF43_00845 [Dermatophilaceae bacterium]|nr:hypothetical protein [Dermatophilaceae bacterium]MBP9917120.1 hypothetical protein [Dermatophilaceae bacterium]